MIDACVLVIVSLYQCMRMLTVLLLTTCILNEVKLHVKPPSMREHIEKFYHGKYVVAKIIRGILHKHNTYTQTLKIEKDKGTYKSNLKATTF